MAAAIRAKLPSGRAAQRLRQRGRERLNCDPELGNLEIARLRLQRTVRRWRNRSLAVGKSMVASLWKNSTACVMPGPERAFGAMPEPKVLAIVTLSLFGAICGQFCDRKRRRSSVGEVKKSL